jgi:hypothetical protein
MDTVLKFGSSVFSGASLGVLGAIGSGVVTMLQEKQRNKHELEMAAANLEAAKAAGQNLVTLEGLKVLSGSYEHDKAAYKDAGFIDILRGSVRPVITYFLVGMVTFLGFWAFRRMGLADPVVTEIAVMCVRMCIELASICVVWWFGGRYFKKNWKA